MSVITAAAHLDESGSRLQQNKNIYILRHSGYVLCSFFGCVKGGNIINLRQKTKAKQTP